MSVIRIGSAPDSWGVWFTDDARQLPYERFLDEVAEAGYRWIELGPFGYLPIDPQQLREELAQRDLTLSAGTVFEHLHRPGSWDTVWGQVSRVAELTAKVGGKHVVVIPEMWRDSATGAAIESRDLSAEQWHAKTSGVDRLAKAMYESYGVALQYHPHADSHVGAPAEVYRLLESTDPDFVHLCLDTGHISYCGGDNLAIIGKYPDRIGYLHLKQVDPAISTAVTTDDVPFGDAVRRGVMTEPPTGIPDLPPILAAIAHLDVDVFAIVEQDMYPCEPDRPLPIAQRTRKFLSGCGIPALHFTPEDVR